METKKYRVNYPDFMVSQLKENCLWIKFSGNFFHNFISFDNRDFLHDYFIEVSKDKEIKTVVIESSYSESGSDEYLRFFLMECPNMDIGHFGFTNTMDRYELHRFCNIIDQTILDIVSMDAFVIHVCKGDVLSVFMNISLACDYKIISTNTVFHNVYQEIGMLPKGGGPFFLSNLIGQAKTCELLMMQPVINAEEALENKIADLVVPVENLESSALEVSKKLAQIQKKTLTGTKRLINYSLKDLKSYLKFETEEIIKIGQQDEFFNQ
ncbi:MAG: enoyl-CoA hydratase/isomerase family protein [Desulforegulaceae bacterium]|nr:enoyl-CoA hydratase/isomerase family protein [Desulforegulaceae bacterium]